MNNWSSYNREKQIALIFNRVSFPSKHFSRFLFPGSNDVTSFHLLVSSCLKWQTSAYVENKSTTLKASLKSHLLNSVSLSQQESDEIFHSMHIILSASFRSLLTILLFMLLLLLLFILIPIIRCNFVPWWMQIRKTNSKCNFRFCFSTSLQFIFHYPKCGYTHTVYESVIICQMQ